MPYFNSGFGKEQWREAVSCVESRAKPGDLIVFHAGYIGIPYDYYTGRSDLTRLRLMDGIENEPVFGGHPPPMRL